MKKEDNREKIFNLSFFAHIYNYKTICLIFSKEQFNKQHNFLIIKFTYKITKS